MIPSHGKNAGTRRDVRDSSSGAKIYAVSLNVLDKTVAASVTDNLGEAIAPSGRWKAKPMPTR
jgi:hypothetical protein